MIAGLNLPELIFILLFNAIPFAVVLYLLVLFVRYLRLSIAEMEGRQRVGAEREPEVSEMRQALSVTLRARREACGMTQELVAHKLGVSRQAVSKWENGASDPSTANLIALAELYGVDPAELLRGIASSKVSVPGGTEVCGS